MRTKVLLGVFAICTIAFAFTVQERHRQDETKALRIQRAILRRDNMYLRRENKQLRCNPFYEEGDPLLLAPLCDLSETMTQPYGVTKYVEAYGGMGMNGHPGIDYAAEEGTPVRASHSGYIFYVKDDHDNAVDGKVGYGNNVKVRYREEQKGYETVYAHLEDVYVQEGQEVRRGQIIGTVGDTGFSSRPHLHYGVRFLWYCHGTGALVRPCEVIDGGNGMHGWVNPSTYMLQ